MAGKMKLANLECRLAVLEERTKPRRIASRADFVIWCANGCEEDVEFTPAMKEALSRASMGQ